MISFAFAKSTTFLKKSSPSTTCVVGLWGKFMMSIFGLGHDDLYAVSIPLKKSIPGPMGIFLTSPPAIMTP